MLNGRPLTRFGKRGVVNFSQAVPAVEALFAGCDCRLYRGEREVQRVFAAVIHGGNAPVRQV